MKWFGTLVLALLLSPLATAADLTFQWDAAPAGSWDNVVLYEVNGTIYTNKGSVAGSLTTMTITGVGAGLHTYVVRGVKNSTESDNSNSAATTIKPGAPSNLRIAVVRVEEDGTISGVRFLTAEEFQAEFFRA
jgi:hypothetical protein